MKRKELQGHDWKVGEVLYEVVYKQYGYHEIPIKVIRLKVTRVYPGKSLHVLPCNKKDEIYMSRYGYILDSNYTQYCSNVFFTKEEADKLFNKKCEEFKNLHAEKLYVELKDELRYLDHRKQAVWGVMRMKILKEAFNVLP